MGLAASEGCGRSLVPAEREVHEMTMKTWRRVGLGAATGLLAIGAGCATRGFAPVMVTHDASAVANCQKVDDLVVKGDTRYDDPEKQLIDLAYEKNANTVLVESTTKPITGVAYRCAAVPAPAAGTENRPGQ